MRPDTEIFIPIELCSDKEKNALQKEEEKEIIQKNIEFHIFTSGEFLSYFMKNILKSPMQTIRMVKLNKRSIITLSTEIKRTSSKKVLEISETQLIKSTYEKFSHERPKAYSYPKDRDLIKKIINPETISLIRVKQNNYEQYKKTKSDGLQKT